MNKLRSTTALVGAAAVTLWAMGGTAQAATMEIAGVGGGAIADNSTVDITFDVTGLTNVVDVDLRLDDISHTWVGDLQISLTSPTGFTTLFSSVSGFGDSSDFLNSNITFDDEGAAWPDVAIIPDGNYQPTDTGSTGGSLAPALNIFDGMDPNGTWTLSIFDDAVGDSGSITGATLILDADDDLAPVPIPASLSFAGIGLAALGAVAHTRRRRKKS